MRVSPRQFLVLALAVKLAGGDALPGMVRAGLPDLQALNDAPWRSVAELDAMMRITREATGDPGFGLVVATSMVQSLYGTFFQLIPHAPTLRAVLDDLCRYTRLLQLDKELSYDVRGRHCILHFVPLGTTAEGRCSRIEQIMGSAMMLLRYYGLRDDDLRHVGFAHRRPAHGSRYAGLFGPDVRFEQPRCEIAIAASLLDVQQPARNANLYGKTKGLAHLELAEVERRDATGAAVSRLLQHSEAALPSLPQSRAASK